MGSHCRLDIPKKEAKGHFFKYYTHCQLIQVGKDGMLFTIIDLDLDEEIENKMVFKQRPSTNTFVILGGWKDFLRQRGLTYGDIVKFSREKILFPTKKTNLDE